MFARAPAAARGGTSGGRGSEALGRLGDLVFPPAAAAPSDASARAPRPRATPPAAADDARLALDDDVLAFLGTAVRAT